jgi:hypothetical protein
MVNNAQQPLRYAIFIAFQRTLKLKAYRIVYIIMFEIHFYILTILDIIIVGREVEDLLKGWLYE